MYGMSGVMVMGTNYILKWELSKNMVRPKSAYTTCNA